MKFLADHMLGSLARWLRFLGFDCAYPQVLPDRELKAIAQKEKRILLTRDKELAKAKGIEVLYIQSVDLDEQLVQLLTTYNLTATDVLSRCGGCNSRLAKVKKESVEGKVPAKVYAWKDEYWECPTCNKYYWQGTHFQGIKAKIDALERKTSTA